MKKVLSAVLMALAVCQFEAAPTQAQTGNVRVGPLADEKPAGGAASAAPKSDAKKSPAGSDKRVGEKSKTADASKRDGQGTAASRETLKKGDSKELATPAAVSSTSTVNAPGGAVAPFSAASDAPPKSGETPLMTATTPATSAPGESGVSSNDTKNLPLPGSNSNTNSAVKVNATPASVAASAQPLSPAPSLTAVYRVGIGDVLDIHLLNQADPRRSTLYTVMAGGVLEYPLVADPMTVTGMTTDELAAQLVAELRHRAVFDKPQVRVSVRDYASHTVLVSGLVSDPGPKTLQREAVPLYVVVAWAQPKTEAGRALVVSHATGTTASVDLNDATAMSMLVQPSDVITLTARPPEFFYVGGEINAPGQKDFHSGITLTQAVLASGGASRPESIKVKVSRQGADGRLVATEYNLREIEDGKIPDPALLPGDRIEVSHFTRK